jgi:TRAP-type C4-dicarboxylate transport system substrate-binding protein
LTAFIHETRVFPNSPPRDAAKARGPPNLQGEDHVTLRRTFIAAVIGFVAATGPSWAQDIQERTIRWGHLNNTDHPVSKGVQKLAEIVAAKSGGKLKIKEFPANQLGTEQQQQSALRGGTQEMQSPATTAFGT